MNSSRVGRYAFALVVFALLFVIGRNAHHRYVNNRLADAVRERDPDAARRWLARGADANISLDVPNRPEYAEPALLTVMRETAAASRNDEVACLLIQHGADIHETLTNHYLISACSNGRARVVRCLLEHGATAVPTDAGGTMPIDVAVDYAPAPVGPADTVSAERRTQIQQQRQQRLPVAREMARLLWQHGAPKHACQAIRLEDANELRAMLAEGVSAEETPTRTYNFGFQPQPPPLLIAAEEGNLECMRLLLAQGANVNRQDDHYFGTPLLGAISSGFEDAARLLLQHGADVNLHPEKSNPPLARACGSLPSLVPELLRRGADVKTGGGASVAAAIGSKRPELVKLLLQRGADMKTGGSMALTAAIQSKQPELVTFLLQKGARCRGKEGREALAAALRYQPDLVPILLAQGADGREQPGELSSLICEAVHANRKELIAPLLRAGANINARRPPYISGAGFVIVSSGPREVQYTTPLMESLTHAPEIMRELLEHGADPNQADWNGDTPLIAAAQSGNVEATRLLLAHKAEVNGTGASQKGATRHTPLYFARRSKHAAVAVLLEQAGGQAR